MKTSVSPTLAPLARGVKVEPPVNPGRFWRRLVMSRRVPVTIVGSSVISFSEIVAEVFDETSRFEPRTTTCSSIPAGWSVTWTRSCVPARSSRPSVTAGANPSFEMMTV